MLFRFTVMENQRASEEMQVIVPIADKLFGYISI